MKRYIVILLFLLSAFLYTQSEKNQGWTTDIEKDVITDERVVTFFLNSREQGDSEHSSLLIKYRESAFTDVYIVWKNMDFVTNTHKVIFRFDTNSPEEYTCENSKSSKSSFLQSDNIDDFISKLSTSKNLAVRGYLNNSTVTITFDVSDFNSLYEEYIKNKDKE